MQENYEDGSKGEIKLVEWRDLIEEIKKSLSKDGVNSVTIAKAAGIKKVKITEEKDDPFAEFLKTPNKA